MSHPLHQPLQGTSVALQPINHITLPMPQVELLKAYDPRFTVPGREPAKELLPEAAALQVRITLITVTCSHHPYHLVNIPGGLAKGFSHVRMHADMSW